MQKRLEMDVQSTSASCVKNGGNTDADLPSTSQHITQKLEQQPSVEIFWDGKLRIYSEINLPLFEADVLVNFCASDILSGDEVFLNVHELAGDKLKDFCAQYQGMGIGNCRLSDSFGLANFKNIAHTILPRPVQGDDLIDLDELVEFDLMLCYRNSLDLITESEFNSIVFTHPLLYGDRYGVAKLAVAAISHFMEHTPNGNQLKCVSIACPNEEIAQCYVEIVAELGQRGWADFVASHSSALYTYLVDTMETETKFEESKKGQTIQDDHGLRPTVLGPAKKGGKLPRELLEYGEIMADTQMLEVIFEREFPLMQYMEDEMEPQFEESILQQPASSKRKFQKRQSYAYEMECLPPNELEQTPTHPNLNQFCMDRYGFDEQYIRDHPDEVYDMLFRSPEGLQLQLSRNLSATILTIEEENGTMLRQYRMTTQNREGETLYFRCSRCESLMRYTNDEYRPKITVKDGFIYGDCYPAHHPQCYPVTKEWVIIQQLDRQARLQMLQLDVASQYGHPNPVEIMGSSEPYKRDRLPPSYIGNGSPMVGDALTQAVKQELVAQSTNSARNRLRPAAELDQTAGHSNRKYPLAAGTSRCMLSAPTNPAEVPIVYRRREAPENATLRAIRKCENELEGRVNEELEQALQAEENLFWKFPGRFARTGSRFVGAPLVKTEPSTRKGQWPPSGALFELEHEEIVTDEAVGREVDKNEHLGEEMEELVVENLPTHENANFTSGINQRVYETRQQRATVVAPPAPSVAMGDRVEDLSMQQPAADGGEGEKAKGKFRKFRVIRKRGRQSNLAFDWRETDMGEEKEKK